MYPHPSRLALGSWLRGEFAQDNTSLERLYTEHGMDASFTLGASVRARILANGLEACRGIEASELDGDRAFEALGDVGMFLAAIRRHEMPVDPEAIKPVHELLKNLGARFGVAPRFLAAHFTIENPAIAGKAKSFTTFDDEQVFIQYNTMGMLYYRAAADALRQVAALGISNPVSESLFWQAAAALRKIFRVNLKLANELNLEVFFHVLRKYYQPYQVGDEVYRGPNAGDISAINEIDIRLGLCDPTTSFYSGILKRKESYIPASDRAALEVAVRAPNFLGQFLSVPGTARHEKWYQRCLRAYLKAVDAHGDVAAQHHNVLVKRFLKIPAKSVSAVTASGPELDEVIRELKKLRDLRKARGAGTAANKIWTLRETLR